MRRLRGLPGDCAGERSRMSQLFDPRSIAVVGASTDPGKLGSVMLGAVRRGSRADAVYAVNPRARAGGFDPSLVAATVRNGEPIDLAILCIPASASPQALREAADCGVGAAVICSGGFAEAGDEGAALQEELTDVVAATGLRLLGPNTSGFFRPGSTTASFVPTVEQIRPGKVAVVAASGGMNHALSFLLSEHGIGIHLGVGLGNAVDVRHADVLDHVAADPDVTAVALHVESVSDGARLLESVSAATVDKPVVAMVVGRGDVARFASSHTGALATEWRTTRALLSEAGAVVVDTEHQLVDAVQALSSTRLPATPDPGVALVTAQAGPGLMILERLLQQRVRVPALSASTQRELSTLLPPMTFQQNPVDTGRPGSGFSRVVTTAAHDPEIDMVAVYALAEPDVLDPAAAVIGSGVSSEVPVVLGVGGPAQALDPITSTAHAGGIPVVTTPTSVADGIAALATDARARWLRQQLDEEPTHAHDLQIPRSVDEAGAKDVLDAVGVRTMPRRACPDHPSAHRAFDDLQHPVAVKILDPQVLHKSDVGGVRLGIGGHEELDEALAILDGIGAPAYLVEEMAPAGIDLFLGARRDPVFGPVVVAGLGGTAAEALEDVVVRSAALSVAAAEAMLDDLRGAAILDGWRGGPTLDRHEFALAVVATARLIRDHPEISEFEINPIRLTSSGLIALDAVVVPTRRNSCDEGTSP